MGRFAEASDLAIGLENVVILEACRSPRQRMQVLRHPKLGRALVLDDVLQHVEAWQALYHEPLVHLGAAFVREVSSVLILGGGSLFAAAEALRYPSVQQCLLVDHDREVLDLMARHYPHAAGVLNDQRFRHVDADVLDFLENNRERFDLVINDALDLLGGGVPQFELLSAHLKAGGACSDLIYRHLLDGDHLAATRAGLADSRGAALSLVVVPEYPGVLHGLTVWGDASIDQGLKMPRNEVQQNWSRSIAPPGLEFYDPRHLAFHLYLPPFLRRAWHGLADEGTTEA